MRQLENRNRLGSKRVSPSVLSVTLLLLSACNPNDATLEATHRSIEELADEFLTATLERNPSMGTYYAIAGARHDRLYDNSLYALAEWEARENAWLSELNTIGAPTEIGSRDWVTYSIMHESLEGSVEARVCRSELWQASTTTAWYRGLPFVFEVRQSARRTNVNSRSIGYVRWPGISIRKYRIFD